MPQTLVGLASQTVLLLLVTRIRFVAASRLPGAWVSSPNCDAPEL